MAPTSTTCASSCPAASFVKFCGNQEARQIADQGGRLSGNGTARVSNDSVVLTGSQRPNGPALYFQGTQIANGVFGDGLRVAGGTITRLGTRVNANGGSTFPAAGQSLSALGGVPAGNVRYYQIWYRNAADFCTSATFNLTNGVRINWAF